MPRSAFTRRTASHDVVLAATESNGHPGGSRRSRIAKWIAATSLVALTGCANERLIQRHVAGAAPVLKAIGAGSSTANACQAHDPTPSELAKQRSVIDPLRAPALYSEVFYGDSDHMQAVFTVDDMRFRRYRQFDDPESGLSGVVILDETSGHAVILFKGMDRPFAEQGGLIGVLTDIGGVLHAKFGTGNSQLPRADAAYTEALCEAVIKSIEMVGYSMGSQIANYLAVTYGATGVVFADMGLDPALVRLHAGDNLQAVRDQARRRIVSLSLSGDLVVKVFGVGEPIGEVVKLPGGLSDLLHQPEIYARAANAMLIARDGSHEQTEAAVGEPAHAGMRLKGKDAIRPTDSGSSVSQSRQQTPLQ